MLTPKRTLDLYPGPLPDPKTLKRGCRAVIGCTVKDDETIQVHVAKVAMTDHPPGMEDHNVWHYPRNYDPTIQWWFPLDGEWVLTEEIPVQASGWRKAETPSVDAGA